MRMISCSTSRLMRGLPGPLRAFEPSNLRGDKLAIPGRDSVRPSYAGDLRESLTAYAMTDLAERASLSVPELQSPFQLRLDDAVLGGQIFIPGQQLLIHRPCHVSQDTRPIHNRPLRYTDLGDSFMDRPQNSTRPPHEQLPTPPN